MNKAVIHYFTGTGNTAHVARMLSDAVGAGGLRQVRMHLVGPARPAPDEQAELHVLAFPVYSFAVPDIMRRYMLALPPGAGAKAAVLAVVGEDNARRSVRGYEGRAIVEATSILRRRGYDVVLTDIVAHVINFTQFVSPPAPAEQDGIAALAHSQVQVIAQRILQGERGLRRCSWPARLGFGATTWLFRLIGRRWLGKLYVADDRCNGCAKCAVHCPVRAVRIVRRRPRWTYACQACQRCINLCPTKAVQTSLARLLVCLAAMPVPYWLILRAPLPAQLLPPAGSAASTMLNVLLWLVGYHLALYLLDKVIFLLEFVPGLRAALGFGLTRRCGRYLERHFRNDLESQP